MGLIAMTEGICESSRVAASLTVPLEVRHDANPRGPGSWVPVGASSPVASWELAFMLIVASFN